MTASMKVYFFIVALCPLGQLHACLSYCIIFVHNSLEELCNI